MQDDIFSFELRRFWVEVQSTITCRLGVDALTEDLAEEKVLDLLKDLDPVFLGRIHSGTREVEILSCRETTDEQAVA